MHLEVALRSLTHFARPARKGICLGYRERVVSLALFDNGATSYGAYELDGMKALLVRDTPVRVLNISESGFSFECHRPFMDGVVGELRLNAAGMERRDVARVGRSMSRPGARAPFVVGGDFLPGVRHPLDAIDRMLSTARPRSIGERPHQKRWRKNA